MTMYSRRHLDDAVFGVIVVAALAMVLGLEGTVFEGIPLGPDARSSSAVPAASSEGATNTAALDVHARGARRARG